MANKEVNDLTSIGTRQTTDEFMLQKTAGGAYRKDTRAGLLTVPTGGSIDSSSGVDLLIKAATNQAITISASDGTITLNDQLVAEQAAVFNAVVRIDNGIREAGNLEYFVKGERKSFVVRGGAAGDFALSMPAVAGGASSLTAKVNKFIQFSGALSAVVATITLLAADGSTYSQAAASTTWTNLGEDQSTVLQTALATALTAFSSGEGRSFTEGDVLRVSHDAADTIEMAVEIEVVHT